MQVHYRPFSSVSRALNAVSADARSLSAKSLALVSEQEYTKKK